MEEVKEVNFKKLLAGVAVGATGLSFLAVVNKPSSVFKNQPDEQNSHEGKLVQFVVDPNDKKNADGVCGHLEEIAVADNHISLYDKFVKRGIDVILSLGGLLVLSPILLGVSAAIYIDDPGPILFTQKRVGRNKRYFKLHKFRSMKMSTPHDVPTHMLENPEQYITSVGKILRKTSLDELPQIWDIFLGNMSVIGPRPGLWNQDLLTAERDKYGANDIKPGLTGWAQINGRDELEISVKAKLDGDYTKQLKQGGFNAFIFDCKCFLGTIFSVLREDGIVEGGTGELHRTSLNKTNDGK